MSMNHAFLVGRVGKDPEIRQARNSDDRIATFSLATSESYKDKSTGEKKEETQWHTIVCFNQHIVPVIDQYVKKGSLIGVEGQIKTRKWQHNDGSDRWSTEIVINRFNGKLTLLASAKGVDRDEHGYGTSTTRETAPAASKQNFPRDLDDEVPF